MRKKSFKVKNETGSFASGISKEFIAQHKSADEFLKAIQDMPHVYMSFNKNDDAVKAVYEQAKGVEPKETKSKDAK